jgi:hypothetical protein
MKSLFQLGMIFTLALAPAVSARAQEEGPVPTQALVNIEPKSTPPAGASELTVQVDNHKEPLTDWQPVQPGNSQVALLIDDGLRETVGRELDNLRKFITSLPPGVEVLVGFMQYGQVVSEQPFTANHELAASTLHLPAGLAGMSASPYICLSDFVKHWPGTEASSSSGMGQSAPHKARFVLMLTNGVDPYNGSTSIMNQDSPYVDESITDAQRAGVAVYAIYFGDAGMRGRRADNSGQNYLAQVTQGTGGISLWEGLGNPVSMAPFLGQFQNAIAETYVATFLAPVGRNPQKDMVRLKFSAPKTKLHAPEEVRPGNVE